MEKSTISIHWRPNDPLLTEMTIDDAETSLRQKDPSYTSFIICRLLVKVILQRSGYAARVLNGTTDHQLSPGLR